jgi:hypothetical protein
MAKHRADEPKSFGTGEREKSHPEGWVDKRIEVDKDPGTKEVYGFRPGEEPRNHRVGG